LSRITKEDVLVTSDGVAQEIAFFSSSDQPLSVAIVIDTSGSVQQIWPDISSAAKNFVRSLKESDRAMVVTFDDEVKIRLPLTSDKKKIDRALWSIATVEGGVGLMNEAILKVLEGEFGRTKGRKAIIVLTDAGEIDPNSSLRLRDRLIQDDTLVYPIYFQTGWNWPRFHKSLPFDEVIKLRGVDSLFDLAKVTGGRFILAENKKFKQEFESITDELSRYFLVGIYVDRETGRSLRIESRREGVVFRTKSIIRPLVGSPQYP
jgi:VWFA-related protein